MRKLYAMPVMLWLIALNCNKGLSPTEAEKLPPADLQFAREVKGGDLTGTWFPRQTHALEANLADPSQIKGLVDSLYLTTALAGSLKFSADKSFAINAIIQIAPTVVLGGVTLHVPPFADTLNESGKYERPWENAFVLPVHPKTFKIDTLGYTATKDSLMMVTLANTFPFPGFDFVKYYLVFHLVK